MIDFIRSWSSPNYNTNVQVYLQVEISPMYSVKFYFVLTENSFNNCFINTFSFLFVQLQFYT